MKGHEYFAMLNEVEQGQFQYNFATCRLNAEDSIEDFMLDEFDDFDSFISSAFLFSKTLEGTKYWQEIRDSQRDGVDASGRRGAPKSISDFMEKLLFLAFVDSVVDSKDYESNESLEDILKDLKIKLSDDEV